MCSPRVVVGQCRGGGGDAAGGHGRGRGRGSAQAAAPQRLHAAPATNSPCLAHGEQESKLASKDQEQESKRGWVEGVSEWCSASGKGIGQGCLIGQGLDGDATSQGHVVLKGMGLMALGGKQRWNGYHLLPFLSLPSHPN